MLIRLTPLTPESCIVLQVDEDNSNLALKEAHYFHVELLNDDGSPRKNEYTIGHKLVTALRNLKLNEKV